MHLTVRILSGLCLIGALCIPRLGWRRPAFGAFLALGLITFPLRAGWPAWPLAPRSCERLVHHDLALHSFRNTPHIVLFALCYLIARRQFTASGPGRAGAWRAHRDGPALAA